MQFITRKKKSPPAVIIVSMIDVLLVVLIFLMVTTNFKQQPAVKLALPESKQSKAGSSENNPLVITVSKQGPFYLQKDPVSFERLQERLMDESRKNPDVTLAIRADTEAAFGQVIKVMDAAKAANIKVVSAYTKGAAK